MDERIALDWVTPPFISCWRWSDDGEAICWSTGETIAFRAELAPIIERLGFRGLPPFTLLVLVLAGLRGDWREPGAAALADFVARVCPDDPSLPGALARGLEGLRTLPGELRARAPMRATIAEMAFANASQLAHPQTSARLLRGFQRLGRLDLEVIGDLSQSIANTEGLERGLRELADRLAELDEARIRMRHGAGVEDAPQAPELSVPERLEGLLARLTEDEELGGLARLARRLSASAHLPRPLALPDREAMGGLAGLSTRGRLDRLVLSELAYDDLLLAARIANNEALYWRQDESPKPPRRGRLVALDGGVRLWGKGRLLAAATALAFAARADGERLTELATIHDARLRPRDLNEREDLIGLLGHLEPAPHPGPAIAALLAAYPDEGEGLDRVLVTSAAAFADERFREAWLAARQPRSELLVAAVSAEGEVELWRLNARGRKRLRSWQLELEDLLAPPRVGVRLRLEDLSDLGVELLRRSPFPLRLPDTAPRASHFTSLEGGRRVVSVTRDGRLLAWGPNPREGPRQVTDLLPAGSLHLLEVHRGEVTVGLLRREELRFVYASLERDEVRRLTLKVTGQGLRGTATHNGALMLIFRDEVQVVASATGRLCAQLTIPPELRWSHRRFFRYGEGWKALTFEGGQVRFETVPHAGEEWWLFDRKRADGPWALLPKRQRLASTVDGRDWPLALPKIREMQVLGMDADGERLLVHDKRPAGLTTTRAVIDVERRIGLETVDDRQLLTPLLGFPSLNLRKRLEGVGRVRGGRLLLLTSRQKGLIVSPTSDDQLVLEAAPESWTFVGMRLFIHGEDVGGARRQYSLHQLVWPQGGRAILDGRGVLHLISGAKGVIQIALILSEPALGIWVSDGRWHGPRGLFIHPPGSDPEARRMSAADAANLLSTFTVGSVL